MLIFLWCREDQADSSLSGQVGYTDLSDSFGSDIDISTLIDHSDQNLCPMSHGFGPRVQDANQGQASHSSGLNHGFMDKCHINS